MIHFRVVNARAEAEAAGPMVVFKLRIDSGAEPIRAIALQCLVRIEPARRHYQADEQRALGEVFGAPPQWSKTMRPLLWAETSRMVPAFEGACEIELPIPCSYDLEVASGKYFHAVRDGVVPLAFLFRGTLFAEHGGRFAVSMVPWDREAYFELPAEIWRAAMDSFFPDQGWLRLHREVIDSLLAFKAARALPSWDAVMRNLLDPHCEPRR